MAFAAGRPALALQNNALVVLGVVATAAFAIRRISLLTLMTRAPQSLVFAGLIGWTAVRNIPSLSWLRPPA